MARSWGAPLFAALVAGAWASACSSDDAREPLLPVAGGGLDAGVDDGDDEGSAAPQSSAGCNAQGAPTYAAGTQMGELEHDGLARSFRVHVPPGYRADRPAALVVMLHGGGGSGRQFELNSARMDAVADRESFLSVYPDGTGAIKTWNGGGCCGSAVSEDVDDVGFVAALLDHLEQTLCIDRQRIFAAGMSNGGIMSHRLACELSDRIAAIAPVSGTNMTASCVPKRPLAVLQIHGTADGHVPYDGGEGCGPAGVAFPSVPATMEAWRLRNGCSSAKTVTFQQGDGSCETYGGCVFGADVTLCSITGGGHSWPGGDPPAGLVECPANGPQSTTFSASEVIWSFFRQHPLSTK
ncbi:MAG: PHB depolymerase family esterase [Myxococcales bacterium]